MKKFWWVVPAITVAIILGLLLWGVVPQCTEPERTSMPVREDPPKTVVEKEYTATPDAEVTVETGVPVVEKPKRLSVRLLHEVFRYGTKATIRLELTNVNLYPCLHLNVDVLDDNVASNPFEVDALAAHDTVEVSIPARIQRRDGAMNELHVQIAFHCLGERRRQVEELSITMRSIMETSFDLEELDGAL